MKDKLSYYFWRVRRLICILKHDWEIGYARKSDTIVSGRYDCKRCYERKYFSKEY